MGTIFVAYGKESYRETVLEFAAQRAAAADDDLFVYHIHESEDESDGRIQTDVEEVIRRTAPEIDFEVSIGRLIHKRVDMNSQIFRSSDNYSI